MAARHAVLADEQRLAGQHADPPVEIGRQEFLRQQEVGLFEQFVADALERRRRLDLVHAAGERAVGDLHHQRQAELVDHLGQVGILGEDHGRRRRHLVLLQQLHQEHFVGAADHRDRIVDHRHAFLPGAAGKAVGVIVDRGGLADEQAVELGELGELALGDQLDVDRVLFGDACKILERVRGARRRLLVLVRIVQHGEIVFGDRTRLGVAPFALGMVVQRLAEEFAFAVGQPGDGAWPDAVDRQPRTRFDDHFQRRAAEPVEQQPPERLEARIAGDAEADQELELAFRLEIGAPGAAVELFLELRQRVLVELLLAQLQHGLDRRHHAVAARLGEQRGVIALGLVGVGTGEVDDLRPPHVEQARSRQVLARGDDLVRGLGVGQVAALVDKDDPAGHGRVSFQSPALCKIRPIMRSKSGTARFVITRFKSIGD